MITEELAGRIRHSNNEISTKPFPTISRNVLRAAIESTAVTRGKDKVRPILTATLLSVSEGVLTAVSTDSYTLTVFTGEATGELDPVMISPDGAASILAMVKAKTVAGEFVLSTGDALILGGPGGSVVVDTISGDYPDVWSLIPEYGFHAEIAATGYNAEYLSRIGKIAKAITKPRTVARVELVTLQDPTRPSRWEIEGDYGNATFLIMPLRKG